MAGFKGEAEHGIRGALREMGKLVGGALAVVGVAESVKHVVVAATAQQEELAVVRNAVKATSGEWVVHGRTVDDVLRRQAVRFGFTVADLAQGFTRIQVGTKDTEQTFSLLDSAMDVSRARHLGLAQSAVILTRASQGNDISLRRLGVIITKVTTNVTHLKREHDLAAAAGVKFTKAQELEYKASLEQAAALDKLATKHKIINEIRSRFGGQSEAFSHTAEGAIQSFKEALNELEVSTGAAILPSLTRVAEGAAKELQILSDSPGIHHAAAAAGREFGNVLHFIHEGASLVAPPLHLVASGLGQILSLSGGADGLLAFAIGFKSIGIATSLATSARVRYAAVMAAGRGETVAAVSAEEAQAAAVLAHTGALEANTAAILENLAATGGANRLRLVSAAGADVAAAGITAETVAIEANTLALVENGAVATAGAGRAAVFGRGLLALAGGPAMLATVGMGLLAFGVYRLASAETEAEKRSDSLGRSLGHLGEGLAKARDLTKQLEDSVSAITTDKISVATARNNVAVAQQALATSDAAKGTVEYESAVNALASAQDGYRLALRQLADDEKAAAQHKRDLADVDQQNLARRLKAIQDTNRLAEQAKVDAQLALSNSFRGRGAQGFSGASIQLDQATAAAARFADQLDKIASKTDDPSAKRREHELAAFARAAGRLPSATEISLVLNAPTDKQALDALATILQGMRKRAAAEGYASGRAFALEFKRGQSGEAHGLFTDLLGELTKVVGVAKDSTGGAIKDATKASIDAARVEVGAARTTLKGLTEKIKTAEEDVASAARSVADSNQSIADAIKSGAKAVADAQSSAAQNLAGIGSSLNDAIDQFLDAQNKTSGALANEPSAAEFRRLRAQILAGEGGPDTERAAHALSAKMQAAQSTNIGDARKEKIKRNIADLVDEFNKGAISLTTFNRRIAALLAREGVTYRAAGKLLGVAFADGFQAQLTGLGQQAAAIAAGPRVKGRTGQEPSIIRPLEALRDSQRAIALAQRNRDDALKVEVKAQGKLAALQGQRQKVQVQAEQASRRLAGLQEQHLRFIKHATAKTNEELRKIREQGAPTPRKPGGRTFAVVGSDPAHDANLGTVNGLRP